MNTRRAVDAYVLRYDVYVQCVRLCAIESETHWESFSWRALRRNSLSLSLSVCLCLYVYIFQLFFVFFGETVSSESSVVIIHFSFVEKALHTQQIHMRAAHSKSVST